MRSPTRIPAVLKTIQAAWLQEPDMRLGQLMVALAGGDPFYIEDGNLQEAARNYIRKGKLDKEQRT